MPTFSLDFTAPHLTRLMDALCGVYDYRTEIAIPDPNVPGMSMLVPNPETRQQFARRMVKRILVEVTLGWETSQRDRTAIAAAPAVNPIDIT